MRHALVLALLLAACTDDSSSSGPDVTGHVTTLQFPASMRGLCVEAQLLDVDTATPGSQYECSVTQTVTATQMESVLPQCNNVQAPSSSTNRPCWAIELDTATCAAGEHLMLAIERADAPPDAVVKAQCVSQ